MWLHVQKQAGSHTVISSNNREITETAIYEAACLAAYHSKSKNSSSVPVDYTIIKNVTLKRVAAHKVAFKPEDFNLAFLSLKISLFLIGG